MRTLRKRIPHREPRLERPWAIFQIALVIAILNPLDGYGQVEFSGKTLAGMDFSGRLTGLDSSTLFLQSLSGNSALQVGIPLKAIGSLELSKSLDADSLLLELESCSGLLPYLSRESLSEIMVTLLPVAEKWSWESLYLWAGRIEANLEDPELRLQATMQKLRAMLELGHFQMLGAELESINDSIDPVSAPALLCWLNAESLRHSGEREESLFWANLPNLQIPEYQGELLSRLDSLQKDLEKTSPMISSGGWRK